MTRDETLTAEEVEGKSEKRMAELKKEFEKYLKDSSDYYDPREPLTERKLLQMWLDCAEPREKRIEELEAQIEKMKCCINELVHLGEFDEYTDEEYLNYQVHEALKNAEQFIKEIKEK